MAIALLTFKLLSCLFHSQFGNNAIVGGNINAGPDVISYTVVTRIWDVCCLDLGSPVIEIFEYSHCMKWIRGQTISHGLRLTHSRKS